MSARDFRSDTITRPTAAMREAMMSAPLGDDVFGDDPSVNRLQDEAARALGFEAAIFAPTGTQSNLIGIMSHCGRGDEMIVGQYAHTYRWEAGGMAVLGSIQPQPIEHAPDGTLPIDAIVAAIKSDDPHFARTRLIALENTIGGKALPPDYLPRVVEIARARGLAVHLDGARLFNAAVAGLVPIDSLGDEQGDRGTPPRDDVLAEARRLCAGVDSVSICLSKGLGAPAGSLLLGSREVIARARRIRKMVGGAMRQSGVLAAAGSHALAHHLSRLVDDHRHAALLARGLGSIISERPNLGELMKVEPAQTNMVFVEIRQEVSASFAEHLRNADVRVTQSGNGPWVRQRWVTHLDVDRNDVLAALDRVADWTPQREA